MRWHDLLDLPWIAKRQIRDVMRAGGDTPDYLGIDAAMSVFRAGDPEEVAAARVGMQETLALAQEASDGRDVGLADRVAVIFRAV